MQAWRLSTGRDASSSQTETRVRTRGSDSILLVSGSSAAEVAAAVKPVSYAYPPPAGAPGSPSNSGRWTSTAKSWRLTTCNVALVLCSPSPSKGAQRNRRMGLRQARASDRLHAFLVLFSTCALRAGRHLKLIREMTGVAVLAAQLSGSGSGASASCRGFSI